MGGRQQSQTIRHRAFHAVSFHGTLQGFVSGHDFSRADNAHKMSRALAPELADTPRA